MALTHVTRANGPLLIEGFDDVVMHVDYEYYKDQAPSNIRFNINHPDGAYVDGNFSENKITHYNVNNGIVSDELMTAAQNALTHAMENYATI